MTFRSYKPWKPQRETQDLLDKVMDVVQEYEADGYDLTVRQVYYQMVARGFIQNNQSEYGRLKRIIDRGRLAGLISWTTIVDRTRNVHRLPAYDDVPDFLTNTPRWFRSDRWEDQDMRFEVWVEKEALAGVFRRVCDELHIPLLACRGYLSSSAAWRASQRLARFTRAGQEVTILHFGDHDPSGIDMTRDNQDRQDLFRDGPDVRWDASAHNHIHVERMALNIDQVREFNPPPNPAKMTDPRGSDYVEEFGEVSWELDALQPKYLADLVRDRVLEDRDEERWDVSTADDNLNRTRLQALSEVWGPDLVRTLDDYILESQDEEE